MYLLYFYTIIKSPLYVWVLGWFREG